MHRTSLATRVVAMMVAMMIDRWGWCSLAVAASKRLTWECLLMVTTVNMSDVGSFCNVIKKAVAYVRLSLAG